MVRAPIDVGNAGGGTLAIMSATNAAIQNLVDEAQAPEIDSKYRLIILAAKRSKQLQRGARPRIEIDPLKHKPTRIALEEVMRGKIHFTVNDGVKDGGS
jgi:DNA-directed RNA polymerase subunit omega